MLLINLAISLFSILKVKTLECVSVINEKCMSGPKIIDFSKNEPVFYPLSIKVNNVAEIVIISMTLWQNYAYVILLKT